MEQRHTLPSFESVKDLTRILPKDECVWEILRRTDRPIVLYGTGNGGDKLIDALSRLDRSPDGVFASDGFVRNRTFHDMPVLSLADAETRFGRDMIILCAFGSSLPDVMDHMRWLNKNYTFFMPELPLYGGDLFDYTYFTEHVDSLYQAYSRLTDNESKELFCQILLYRLSGKIDYLEETESFAHSLNSLIRPEAVRTALDGGAFTGDTARDMLQVFPHMTSLLAAEPDERTFCKLSAFADSSHGIVYPVHCALSDTVGNFTFISSGSRGSGIDGRNKRAKTVEIHTETVDSLCCDLSLDLLKLDIEGEESAALQGAVDTVRRDCPALAVSLYHRSEDLFYLIHQIAGMCGENYAYYLRRVPCFPAWDLVLYAIPQRMRKI